MIKQATKSVFSVVLLLLSCNLMADLIMTKGGATGAWFNQTRNGEGFYIEIINIPNSGNAASVAIGTFDSNNSASGFAFEGEGGLGEFCTSIWTASPE